MKKIGTFPRNGKACKLVTWGPCFVAVWHFINVDKKNDPCEHVAGQLHLPAFGYVKNSAHKLA